MGLDKPLHHQLGPTDAEIRQHVQHKHSAIPIS
jgi:hypothetical protein